MLEKLNSTGLYADITNQVYTWCDDGTETDERWIGWCLELKHWYRSSESIRGFSPFRGQIENKKWPLKKVLKIHKIKLKNLQKCLL